MNSYYEIKEDIIKQYFRESGEVKARKIITKINNSRHTASFMYDTRSKRIIPVYEDISAAVLSNVSLSFARSSTVRFACLILLDKWNDEVNQELQLASEYQLNKILRSIYQNVH